MTDKAFRLSPVQVLVAALAVIALCSVQAAAAAESLLYSFNTYAHGQEPAGGLIADAAGNLYGATTYGGLYGAGAIFELSPGSAGSWTETVLYSFKDTNRGATDGRAPYGALVFDKTGNLYGATTWGGTGGVGTIFELTQSKGKWAETVLWNFDSGNGFNPQGGLVFDHAGNLYGTTRFGGGYTQQMCSFDGGCGTVFQLQPTSKGWKETVIYVFQGLADGLLPNDGLAIDAAGNLYGTTSALYSSSGVVFELTPSSNGMWTETTIYTFTGGSDGFGPGGSLILDGAGTTLYGTTSGGGTGTGCNSGGPCGTVFQLAPGSGGQWNESVIYNFNGTDGQAPIGKLVFDQSGNLYGTTSVGGNGLGTVFALTPSSSGSWSESVLWDFTGGSDGQMPGYGVIRGTAGQLYGAAGSVFGGSGTNINGTVFELTPGNAGQWQETTLTNFPDTDGGYPQSNLIADAAGNFYGTTSQGGAHGFGTVFRLTKSTTGWKEIVLYNFTTGNAGGPFRFSNPSALIFDAAGNLYGETQYGGPANHGTVFELSPTDGGEWKETDLFRFSGGKTGVHPSGGLVFDTEGNLYGTTQSGGNQTTCTYGCGLVFKLTPSGLHWTETVLYSFAGGSDGAEPVAGLIFDQAGNLYGTTEIGGAQGNACGCGTVFELSPSVGAIWSESLLHRFSNAHGDGALPFAALTFDQAGNLYGTTANGGNKGFTCAPQGCGTVFELSPTAKGWNERVLYEFTGSAGNFPTAALTFDQSGNLLGTAEGGLYGSDGIVFELSPTSGGSWTETVLYSFGDFSGDGLFPQAGLSLDSTGHLYGTTIDGGRAGEGAVFQITP